MTPTAIEQARIHGAGVVSVDRVPLGDCGPRDVIVDVHACGICGSDLSYIKMGGLAGPKGEPMALGHELAGVIREVGSDVTGLAVGGRVVVHPGDDELGRIGNGAPEGGLADAVLVREAARGDRLFAVPEGMSLDIAALAEPVAVGMHAAEQLEPTPSDTVAVFGCGPIGLAAIASLADRGLTSIVGIDLSTSRRELAQRFGASVTIDPAQQSVWRELSATHGQSAGAFGRSPATSCFVEASGSDAVLTGIIDRCGRGARISVVALHYTPVPVNFVSVLMKELTIRGSMEYPARFADAIDLLSRRDLSPMITDRFPLRDIGRALQMLGESRECGKVMIEMAASR